MIKTIIKKEARRINHWKNVIIDPRPKLSVLLYHRVMPEVKKNKLNTVVSIAAFEKQIDQLSCKYRIVSLAEAISGVGSDKTRVALTFDDGYWDNYEIAFPILKKKGIPATFFITTDYIDEKARFSDNRVINKKTGQPYEFIKDRFMTWSEAKRMGDAGMEIGAHGVTHDSLTAMSIDAARREIFDSKSIIEKNIGKPCNHFSFPFGSRRDYNDCLVDIVREAGFKRCMLNIHGYNYDDDKEFCLKRIIMDEFTDTAHILG
jgi:peptidoglycan/xylan/chitin deacetylase (PgdA/CDA1 family)